jgi:hypothetical protein
MVAPDASSDLDCRGLSACRLTLVRMLELLLETLLGRRVRKLKTLVAGFTAAVMLIVPGAAAAILDAAIHAEQALVTPRVEQMLRNISRHLAHGRPLPPVSRLRQNPP